MSARRLEVESVAEGLLELLESRGVRCFFGGGAGTDFPPVIEAFARRQALGVLGWSPGAALGAKLAQPDRTVVCAVGDGSHVFGVPTATHHTARACGTRPPACSCWPWSKVGTGSQHSPT